MTKTHKVILGVAVLALITLTAAFAVNNSNGKSGTKSMNANSCCSLKATTGCPMDTCHASKDACCCKDNCKCCDGCKGGTCTCEDCQCCDCCKKKACCCKDNCKCCDGCKGGTCTCEDCQCCDCCKK